MTYFLLFCLGVVCYLLLGMAWAKVVEKYSPQATSFDLALWPISAVFHVIALVFYLAVGRAREVAYQKEKARRLAKIEKAFQDFEDTRGGTCMNVAVTRNEL